jgi:hypothetical protein
VWQQESIFVGSRKKKGKKERKKKAKKDENFKDPCPD